MVWGALLQAGGSYLGGEASKKEAARAADAGRMYENAYGQYAGWQDKAQTGLYQNLHGLSQEGLANDRALGEALGSPNRQMAGRAGAADAHSRLDSALGMAKAPSADRGWLGASNGGKAWGANYDAQQLRPEMDARRGMIEQMRGQQGMATYDRNALGQAGDRSIDIARRGNEMQQQESALDAYRRQILEQAGVKFQYKGPGAGYYNQQMFAQGANLAGQGLLSYNSSQQQGAPGGYSNSTTPSYRLQGPAKG